MGEVNDWWYIFTFVVFFFSRLLMATYLYIVTIPCLIFFTLKFIWQRYCYHLNKWRLQTNTHIDKNLWKVVRFWYIVYLHICSCRKSNKPTIRGPTVMLLNKKKNNTEGKLDKLNTTNLRHFSSSGIIVVFTFSFAFIFAIFIIETKSIWPFLTLNKYKRRPISFSLFFIWKM